MFKLSKEICLIKLCQSILLHKKNYEKLINRNVNRFLSTNLNSQENYTLTELSNVFLKLPINNIDTSICNDEEELDLSQDTQNNVEKILSTEGCRLTSLIIGNNCDSSILPIIKKYCPYINNLVLDLKNYKEIDFEQSLPFMDNLKSININCKNRCQDVDGTINHIPLWLIMNLYYEIEKIIIKTDSFADSNLLSIIYPTSYDMCSTNAMGRFDSLYHLELNGAYIGVKTIETILKKKSLIHLSLVNCCCDEKFESVFNRLKFLFNLNDTFSLINLEYLNFENVKYIDVFINILKNWDKLKNINLTGVHTFDQCTFGKLNVLEYLNMNECCVDDDVLIDIANNCKELKLLNITNSNIQDVHLTELSIKEIIKLTNLEYLKIQTTNEIDKNIILNISNNCKKLKHFQVNSVIL